MIGCGLTLRLTTGADWLMEGDTVIPPSVSSLRTNGGLVEDLVADGVTVLEDGLLPNIVLAAGTDDDGGAVTLVG